MLENLASAADLTEDEVDNIMHALVKDMSMLDELIYNDTLKMLLFFRRKLHGRVNMARLQAQRLAQETEKLSTFQAQVASTIDHLWEKGTLSSRDRDELLERVEGERERIAIEARRYDFSSSFCFDL